MVIALLAPEAPISVPYHLFSHRTRTKQLECSEKEKMENKGYLQVPK